jgi:glycosyltransferase involved in cell wall biosynthesis
MKITHIVGSLESQYGGPSRSVRRLAAAAATIGNDVELLTSAPAAVALENSGRLHVHTWRRGWPGAFCPVPEMAAHLLRSPSEIVHHHGLWLRTLHYARSKAARDRIPLILSPRGMMSSWAWRHHRAHKAFAARFLHPGALEAVTGWHATSVEEADDIRRRGFSQPVCVAPNGVDQPNAAEIVAAAEFWRNRAPIVDTRRIALFYSRYHPKKRIVELIDLWAAAAPPDWLLLVVGVPEEYSIMQLRNYVLRAGAVGRIEVYTGVDRPAPYPVASLFLLPSHSENFGLVIAEAMAHGVPVVVTDTTPWTALNRDNLGWCVPWEKYPQTVKSALAETPDQLRERGARARDWVLREFSWENSARQLSEFYAASRKSAA